jgi:2-keto-3-deoxy-L-rhamnonate aldolase RhmA
VQDADEARRAVGLLPAIPPDGVRGMAGMSRGSKFGPVPDYFRTRIGPWA